MGKTKCISNDGILDAVYDLADICGMRIDEFIAHLQEEYGDPEFQTDGLPEEVIAELQTAKQLRKESRDAKRAQTAKQEMQDQIDAFRARFPQVTAEQIPEEVWEEVASGTDLTHAYALYALSEQAGDRRAQDINREAAARSAAATGDGATEPSFTREQVENMSASEVAKNYKNILHALGKWKF